MRSPEVFHLRIENGSTTEIAEWHRVVMWGKLADIAKHDAKLFHINNIRIISENIIYFFQVMLLFLRYLFQIYLPPLQRQYLEL